MTRQDNRLRTAVLAALPLLLLAGAAVAQDRPGFLDNLFNRGEPDSQSQVEVRRSGQPAQGDPGDISVRLDRMESALRQLTGTLEQLQYRNQQLEIQLKRMQDDTEYRFQQLGARAAPAAAPQRAMPPGPVNAPPTTTPGGRSDVFDPNRNPTAPGAPRQGRAA